MALLPRPGGGPAWEQLKSLALDAVQSVHTRRAYDHALTAFHAWYRPDKHGAFGKHVVEAYRAGLGARGLSPSSINVQLAAIRKLARVAVERDWLSADAAAGVAGVEGARCSGVRAGKWLSREQAQRLIGLPDAATVQGKRDQALLALLVGCGLRRAELAALTMERIQVREGRWAIVDLVGKGSRVRTVPMPDWVKGCVGRWTEAAGITSGNVLRPVNKAGQPAGASMTGQSVFDLVERYGLQLGIGIAPHDLRRTFAKLAHRGNARLEQIQLSLGHASVQTTERYLGLQQDLVDAPCDRLGLKL